MPIYEYNCPKCGHFEAIHAAADKPLKAKPGCEHKDCPKKAERLISAAAFHLKGGGWYKDGYGSGGGSSSSASEGSNAASGASSSETGSTKEKKKKDSLKTAPADAPKAGCGSGCKCH